MAKLNYFLPLQVGAPDYKKSIQQFNPSNFSSNFGPYLAGLFEGDGHIWIPKTKYAPSGKKYVPHFSITFSEVEYPLVLKLKSILGGKIRFKKENHAFVLTFCTISELNNIICLINGYLRGPKIEHFKLLIDWLNKNTDSSLICKSLDSSDLLKNAWLSGFIDADGSFDIRVSLVKNGATKDRVAARFRLEQALVDSKSQMSYFNLFSLISTSLLIRLAVSNHKNKTIPFSQLPRSFVSSQQPSLPDPVSFNKKKEYRKNRKEREGNETKEGAVREYFLISLSSQKARANLVDYLDSYPLFSSKFLNYKDWQECHYLINKKEHLTEKGKNTALLLKSKMNTKRTYYNWDHLSKLENY